MVDPILPFCYEGEFDFSQGKKRLVSTFALCNQFIHSHYFVPFIPGGKGLFGVFVCSDFKRKTGIYFISTFDMVAIFRLVGVDAVRSKTYERMPNGEVKVKAE